MHIVFYGPEGSGKGTQAKLLADKLKLPLLTSGDLVRQAAQDDKGLIGDAARQALLKGKYVDDKKMFTLWKERLKKEDAKKGWILDGFPRNINQAKFLSRLIKKYGYEINHFIYLKISDEEAIKRLKKRNRKLFTGSKIVHDAPQRVKGRLKEYKKYERDLLDYFEKKGILLNINGEKKVDEVHKDILEELDIR